MFDFAFQKFFEIFLTIFKFFSLLQINIFVMFLYFFKKIYVEILSGWDVRPRNFLIFQFFSLLQNNIFFMFLYYFLNNFFKKIYIDIVSG
jgi:hypothetical protein